MYHTSLSPVSNNQSPGACFSAPGRGFEIMTYGKKTRRRLTALGGLVAVAAALSLAGCTGQIKQRNSDAVESYRSEAFPADAWTEGVALLTATGERTEGVEYRKLLGDIVEESLREKRPDIKVVPYWKALSIINTDGLTSEYALMLEHYDETGILDSRVLSKLGRSIGVRYFLQPRLVSFEQYQHGRFGFLGLTILKTHESKIKVYLELWRAEDGLLMWIGKGEANIAVENMLQRQVSFEDVAGLAVEKIVEKIP